MKMYVFNHLGLLILFHFLFTGNELAAKEKLTVLTYNIWNGYDFGKDTIRRQQLLNWLSGEEADIIAWQELCNYTDDKLREDATRLGHPYSILLKSTGYSVGVSSRYPIVLRERIMDGMHHGSLHVQIKGVEIFIVHLAPHSFKFKGAVFLVGF